MTENLRLVFEAGDVLTPADTNVSTNTTVTLATQPANQPATGTRSDGTTWQYYDWGFSDSGDYSLLTEQVNDRWLSRINPYNRESETSAGDQTGEDQLFGVWYNWYTATAGTGKLSTAINVYANSDICPSRWIMPGTNDINTLIKTTYGYLQNAGTQETKEAFTALRQQLNNFPLSFSSPGYIHAFDGNSAMMGNAAVYWTRRSGTSTQSTTGLPINARTLRWNGAGDTLYINTANYYKLAGGLIRCTALH